MVVVVQKQTMERVHLLMKGVSKYCGGDAELPQAAVVHR